MTLCFVKLLVASVQVARNSSSFHDVSTSTSDAAWKAHIELQQSKLRQSDAMRLKIRAIDVGRQDQVARQFAQSAIDGIAGVRSFKGQSVICLGARRSADDDLFDPPALVEWALSDSAKKRRLGKIFLFHSRFVEESMNMHQI